ncbi:hypothetical protein [Streptomyces sp. NPDC048309]|uniref:hypothetical protein n=1 Tax=Streptomyces sp. NPDC048309 TaxID=3154618 RepID=UPI0033DAE0B8
MRTCIGMHDGPPMHGGTAVADADGTLAPDGTGHARRNTVADADGTLAPDGPPMHDATAMRDDHYDVVRPLRRRTSTMHPARWSRPGTPVLQLALGPPSARPPPALSWPSPLLEPGFSRPAAPSS